jgi:hypothetical protein
MRQSFDWNRRNFLTRATGAALGAGALIQSETSPLHAQVIGPDNTQVAEIYELQAAYHKAKTTQDLDLMMSLWHPDAILNLIGDPQGPYIGIDRIRSFYERSGSFTHRRFSLVPSFKLQIDVQGHLAWFYFECHDVGDFDLPTRFIAADAFLAGTVRKDGAKWLFWDTTGGPASPLSIDHYYLP